MPTGCSGAQPPGPQHRVSGGTEEETGDVQCCHQGERERGEGVVAGLLQGLKCIGEE